MEEPLPGRLRQNSWKDDFVWYFEVEKGGIVNLDDLYMYMWHWFEKEMYTSWASGDNKIEDFYLHRIRPDGVQENLIWWRATRPITKWINYSCKMDWQNFGSKQTEIMYNDKKIKAHKIGVVIRVWWWVQWDPKNKWEKSILGKMTRWFHQYLLNNEMEMHRDKCKEIARRLENEMKAYFEITTDIPMPRTWFPEEGYKWEKQKPEPKEFENLPRKPDWQI